MLKLNKKAFTLVEILIVVIIIGILMSAFLPRLKGAQERARDAARKANISQISTALELYFNDQGTYPTGYCANDLKDTLVPTYLSSIPTDPQAKRITYGTKDGGCQDGNYAYAPLYKNGAEAGGAVLIANVEAEGKVGNFVLTSNASSNKNFIASNDVTDNNPTNKRFGTDVNAGGPNTLSNDTLQQDDHFASADVAANSICKDTKVDTNVNTYGVGCRGPANKISGTAKSNGTMVYVRFN